MPMIDNEQDEKRDSLYTKYESGEAGNRLVLKSKLYKVTFHFIKEPKSTSVACAGENCFFCSAGEKKSYEYNYAVLLNDKPGFMDIKPSVFFAIQGIAKAQKKDPRQITWTVIKTGQDLGTQYTVSKEDNLTEKEYEVTQGDLEKNNELLRKNMVLREEQLVKNYEEISK